MGYADENAPVPRPLDAPTPPRSATERLIGWGYGLALASILFVPLAIPALVLGAMAASRDRLRSGIQIMVIALIAGFLGFLIGSAVVDRLDADVAAGNLGLYEEEIRPALAEQTGVDVTAVDCISRSEADARCIATFADDSSVGVNVEADPATGEWFWQTEP